MNKRMISGSGLVLAAGLFIALIIVSNATLTSWRLDLTENRLYTLSQGSKNILAAIDEPIQLRYYYSAKLFADIPQFKTYGDRVRDILGEYVAHSRGKLQLTVTDPEPFSEAEDQAVAYGIRQIPVGQTGEMGYFGLVASNTTDDELVIPLFQPSREEALEYELTKIVYQLDNPRKRKLGVMSWLPGFGGSSPGMPADAPAPGLTTIMGLVRDAYEVRNLNVDATRIEPDIDTLLIIHPKDVKRQTLYAIDQFVLRGGKAMVFVDPLAEEDPVEPDPQSPMVLPKRDSNLPELFEKWGIKLVEEKVVVDAGRPMRVQYAGSRGPQTIEYIPWIALEKDSFNPDDFTTNELSLLHVGNAGALEILEGGTATVTPLLSSSRESMLLERDAVLFQRDPAGLLAIFQSADKPHVIGARITGTVRTLFPEGRLKVEGQMEDDPDFAAESKESVNIVVIADTDLLADRFWVQFQNYLGTRVPTPIADNADFIINALDNLGGNDDLISLRSRGSYARPFERVDAIRREAETQFRDKERALQARLQETEQKILALQSSTEQVTGEFLLSPEQRREIDAFRQEQINTRKQLRAVQHDLQKNIEQLGARLKFVNIGLIPILIGLFALAMGLYRLSRTGSRP